MKSLLMYPDRDFDPKQPAPENAADLTQDLELATLLDAMAKGDVFLRDIATVCLLSSLDTPDAIAYRQAILADCLRHPRVVREIYDIAAGAVKAEKGVYLGLSRGSPDTLLNRSLNVLDLFMEALGHVRQLTDEHGRQFESSGFTRFFEMVRRELDDEYLLLLTDHLKRLRFRDGVLARVSLGEWSRGAHHRAVTPKTESLGFFNRIPVKRPRYTLVIPERDDNGFRSLAGMRNRALNHIANSLARATEHVLSFFTLLRAELAFYVGGLNLHERLTQTGMPTCFATPAAGGTPVLSARGLYDPSLTLHIDARLTGNDIDADGMFLVMITGANQGGKSTFLRALGLAHLMMQCGLFVGAESFAASICPAIFTHYTREEDASMSSGKLDEELSRMSTITDHIRSGCLLLCSESFASTNEREGSEIARGVVRAMVSRGVRICFVTHLFDLSQSIYEQSLDHALFLRAERRPDGLRTFKLTEGEPLPTSFGEDLYRRTFGSSVAVQEEGG